MLRMVKQQTKSSAQLKKLKKSWYPILAPKIFGEVQIGESLINEPEQLVNKFMKVNLASLTNDGRHRGIEVYLKVVKVEGSRGMTTILGFSTYQNSVKKLIRRKKEKIEDSFRVVTNDNKTIVVKPMLIAHSNISHSVCTSVRKKLREIVVNKAKQDSFEKLIGDFLTGKLQKDIKIEVDKITPIKIFEIRDFSLVKKNQ